MIRTAVPFGYAFLFLGLLAVTLGGVGLLWRGLRTRPRRDALVLAGGICLLCPALILVADTAAHDRLELNPIFGDAEVLGQWRYRAATLDLQSGGAYTCAGRACGTLGRSGRWERRDDFELAFQPAAGPLVVLRVVQSGADLCLTSQLGDPDTWDGRLLFRHVTPAS